MAKKLRGWGVNLANPKSANVSDQKFVKIGKNLATPWNVI